MALFLIALAVIALLVIGLLAVASMRPDTFHVERSATINAPSSTVHSILTDLRRSVEWSPFEKGLKDLKALAESEAQRLPGKSQTAAA